VNLQNKIFGSASNSPGADTALPPKISQRCSLQWILVRPQRRLDTQSIA